MKGEERRVREWEHRVREWDLKGEERGTVAGDLHGDERYRVG